MDLDLLDLFSLIGRTVRAFVKDTATMMLRGIGRMRLQNSSMAHWALDP